MLRLAAQSNRYASAQIVHAGLMRFDIRRIRSGHQAPNPVLLAVPPAMKCFMTKSIVLYGERIEFFKTRRHKLTIVCDRYEYEQKSHLHRFYYQKSLQCVLKDGHYLLSMAQLNEESKVSPNSVVH